MNSSDNFQPWWISPPGATIVEVLRERSIKKSQVISVLGMSAEEFDALEKGRISIDSSLATKISVEIGGSVEFWIAREKHYRDDMRRLSVATEWLANLPIKDMQNYRWIDTSDDKIENLLKCFDFFDVKTVEEWDSRYLNQENTVTFRKSASFQVKKGPVVSWLRAAEIDSAKIDCRDWDVSQFDMSLQEIKKLTSNKDPQVFVPRLQAICAASGVATVIVRAPSGCPTNGAARFLSDNKAMIVLSARHLADDQFWFSFFHEAAHLVLHENWLRNPFFDPQYQESLESEANEYAVSTLFSDSARVKIKTLPLTAEKIRRFAYEAGVSPGIVVGQLQHMNRINHGYLNSLKRRYSWGD